MEQLLSQLFGDDRILMFHCMLAALLGLAMAVVSITNAGDGLPRCRPRDGEKAAARVPLTPCTPGATGRS